MNQRKMRKYIIKLIRVQIQFFIAWINYKIKIFFSILTYKNKIRIRRRKKH